MVLAGDFNAVVCKTCDTDCVSTSKQALSQACGKFGYGTRNQKGQRLHQCCTHENLTIGNTLFDKPDNKMWTHRSVKTGGVESLRQIDFIMVGNKDKWRLQHVDTEDEMYTGNDHRTVTATLKIKREQPNSNKDGKSNESRVNLKSWEPRSKEDYASALDENIATECNNNQEWAKKSNSEKVDTLEKIFIHTAVQHTKPNKKDEAKVTVSDLNLRTAIEGRKYFSREQTV